MLSLLWEANVWLALFCNAVAGPVVTEELANDDSSAVADWCYKLDVLEVKKTVRLQTVAPRLRYTPADGANLMQFVVYEETTPDDWTLLWNSGLRNIGITEAFHASPAIDILLEAGNTYAVGFYLPDGNYTYWFDSPAILEDFDWAEMTGSVFTQENTSYTLPNRIENTSPSAHAYWMQITVEILDADGDGFVEGEDCDDESATTYPGAPELCDNVDNDCTGLPDDPVDHAYWYPDSDGDGFGDDAGEVDLCDGSAPQAGWVMVAGDCDDADELSFPGAREYCDARDNDCNLTVDNNLVYEDGYADNDMDGFGNPAQARPWCERVLPADVSLDPRDCDDTDATVYPRAPEICDGLDNDCNGAADDGLVRTTMYVDADGDGHGEPSSAFEWCDVPPPGGATVGDDCDDTDAARFPGNPEVCDGRDNDCDEVVQGEDDFDADGWLDCEDCGREDATVFPGALELCDGIDHNCDGIVPERLDCDPNPKETVGVTGCGCHSFSPRTGAGVWLLALALWTRRRRTQSGA